MHVIPVFDQDNISLAMKIVLQLAGGKRPMSRGEDRAIRSFEAFVLDWGNDLQLLAEKSGGIEDLLVEGSLPPVDLEALSTAFKATSYAHVPEVIAMAQLAFGDEIEPTSEVMIEDEAMEAGRALELTSAFWIAHGPTLLIWSQGIMPDSYRRSIG